MHPHELLQKLEEAPYSVNMTNCRSCILTCLFSLGLALSFKRPLAAQMIPRIERSDASRIRIFLKDGFVELENKNHPESMWTILSIQNRPVRDGRANIPLLTHLFDSLKKKDGADLFSDTRTDELRDRRIAHFEPDDVEEVDLRGKCGKKHFRRDGDRWANPLQRSEKIENWLSQLLSLRYEQIDETPTKPLEQKTKPYCRIDLLGRRESRESIELRKDRRSYWISSSRLPARYRLNGSETDALISGVSKI